MFPRHVRWYRLLLLLLVTVNSDEAIAKTDSNLNLDTGLGISVACPASLSGSSSCGGIAPPMQASFTNSISDGDIAAFGLIGGSITGTPDGDVIILGLESGSGVISGCDYIDRQFLIYDDANSNGILESSEFIQSCSVRYIIGDSSPPIVNSGGALYLNCNDSNKQQQLDFWLASGAYSNIEDCSTVTIVNDFTGSNTFCEEVNINVNFTFTDECGNQTVLSEEFIFSTFFELQCFPQIVDCYNTEFLVGATSLAEFNDFHGIANFCSPDVSISYVDVNPIASLCELPLDGTEIIERTYTFTDNICGQTYDCIQYIDVFRYQPYFESGGYSCDIPIPNNQPLTMNDIYDLGGVIDACGKKFSVTFVDDIPILPGAGCNGTVVNRTYTLTDDCDSYDFVETYNITNAITIECPLDFLPTFNCAGDEYASSGSMTGSDYVKLGGFITTCNTATITYQDTPDNLTPCDYNIPITRDITIINGCGLTRSCSYQFQFEDLGIDFQCPFMDFGVKFEGTIPAPYASMEEIICAGGYVNSTCTAYNISHIDNPPTPNFYSGNGSDYIERTYTITNDCGQVASCTQFIQYYTAFARLADCGPATNIIVDCNDTSAGGPFINDLVAAELANCTTALESGGTVTVSNNFSSITYTGSGTTQDVIFTLDDGTGNVTDCNKTITLIGNCPVSVNCDAVCNIIVNCEDAMTGGPTINDLVAAELATCAAALEAGSTSPNGETVTVTNNFSSIVYTGSGTTQDVIFTVSDNLGNTINCTNSITLQGECTIGLNCTPATDIVIDCNDANPLGPTIANLIDAAIENCKAELEAGSSSPDGGPVVVSDNYLSLPYAGNGSTQDIVFRITDNEGNFVDCTKTLTIIGDCKFVICPPTPFFICEDGLPPPFTSFKAFADAGGIYDFLACDTMSITSSDDDTFESLDFCSTDKIEIRRLYTLTDDCGQIFRCRMKLRYSRNIIGPEMVCPPESTVNVNVTSCTYQATLTPPAAASGCSLLDVVSVSAVNYPGNVVDLPAGQHIIQWRAIDECGRSSFCDQIINVTGAGTDLSIICDGSEMAFLEANGQANVPAEQFVVAVNDACGAAGPYVYQIRRLSADYCGTAGSSNVFGPSITVCCEDLSQMVNVAIRVTDTNGNQAICEAQVVVKDLISPTLISCPGNMNVSCSTNIDLDDLSPFGVASGSDNCPDGFTIVESYVDNRADCGLGNIVRTFTLKDFANNVTTCTQTLTVTDYNPLTYNSIVWPADNTYTNLCNDDIPTPEVAGVPMYSTNFCSQPLVNHTDNVFVEGPGCMTVSRKWVVIDWCLFESGADPSQYRFEYTQLITLQNNINPVFDACVSSVVTCGNELSCTGMINLTMTATDDCATPDELIYAYTLTLEGGAIINGQGNSINSPYPYGNHSIVWSVTDQCGNYTTCAQNIEIKDCKPPNAICLSGITINLNFQGGGEPVAEIWAKDLDVSSSDNCTPTSELEFAFDVNFTQQALSFTCADAGTSQIVRMYVRDLDGNVGFCKTTIGVQDNFNLCTTTITNEDDEIMIAGRIATQSNLLMENVDVMLENSQDAMHYMTDNEGLYAFENLPMYENFNLIPSYEDEILNGISTADILFIQRHILGIEKFDSPYKIIAADINNSESISGVDILELRKVILGLQDEFTQSEVWKFVDPNTGMTDPNHPFPYNENMSLLNLDHNAYNMDFVGVKTGDVNYSALINGFIPETNILTRSQETLRLISNSLERGSVQLTVNTDQALSGFQLAFRISGSTDQFNLSSSIIDIDERNYSISDDVVKISWSTAEAIQLTKGQTLFSMTLGKDADYEILYDLPMFETEAYNASIRTMDIEINIEDSIVNDEWQVFRNTPNPFYDYTTIPFTAPKESQLTLSVFDVNGKLLFQEMRKVNEGYQKWELSATDLGNVHGVLYYRLESDDFSSTQPFIRLK